MAGDDLAKGRRRRVVLARLVDQEGAGEPPSIRYRDHRGREATIRLASWRRWASTATPVRLATEKRAVLQEKDAA